MNTFLDLFKQSVIVQGLVTIIVVIFAGLEILQTHTLSTDMHWLVALVIGYWFGAKSTNMVSNAIENLQNAKSTDKSNPTT